MTAAVDARAPRGICFPKEWRRLHLRDATRAAVAVPPGRTVGILLDALDIRASKAEDPLAGWGRETHRALFSYRIGSAPSGLFTTSNGCGRAREPVARRMLDAQSDDVCGTRQPAGFH